MSCPDKGSFNALNKICEDRAQDEFLASTRCALRCKDGMMLIKQSGCQALAVTIPICVSVLVVFHKDVGLS